MITTETAKVYRAAGRRYFTKHGACRALAWKTISAKCHCEDNQVERLVDCDVTTAHLNCRFHDELNHFQLSAYGERVAARYMRLLKRRIA